MNLKAVFLDCSGAIVNDAAIRRELFAELLLAENLRPEPGEYWESCLGRSDRAAIAALLERRGRSVSTESLARLSDRYAEAYCQRLASLERLPICPGVLEFTHQLWTAGLVLGIVTGLPRQVVEWVLQQAGLQLPFTTIVTSDEAAASKPAPQGYQQAVARLAQRYGDLRASNCIAIESTYAGIAAARAAGLLAVAVANTYPLHLLQRRADWAIDDLRQLELERVSRALVRQQC